MADRKVTAGELLDLVSNGAKVMRQKRPEDAEFAAAMRELTQKLGELLARDPNVIVQNTPMDLKVEAPPVHVDYRPPAIKMPAPTVVVNSAKTRAYEFEIIRNDRGQIATVKAVVRDEQ